MRPASPPPPTYAFGYRAPPESGNAINGLGQAHRSRARQVFHASGGEPLAWKALDDFFSLINPWRVVKHVLFNTWQLRRADGTVAAERRVVTDPVSMSREVKTLALGLGADVVGVAEVGEDALYEGRNPGLRYAIVLGLSMDRAEMVHAPQVRAAAEVMRCYRRLARLAVRLGERIRAWGWPARAYGNPNSTDRWTRRSTSAWTTSAPSAAAAWTTARRAPSSRRSSSCAASASGTWTSTSASPTS
jgi:hypothetical protein